MIKQRLNLGILFGGRSCEHEVSVTSSKSILKAIDTEKYDVHLIGIDKSGFWHLTQDIKTIAGSGFVQAIGYEESIDTPKAVSLGLHNHGNLTHCSRTELNEPANIPKLDVIFPVLHGTFGEDGTVQGVLEMAGLPYVGCSVAASALAMDKALAKKVFECEGIPQAPYLSATVFSWQAESEKILDDVEKQLGYPVFIKPANLGSSVGVSKAKTRQELIEGVVLALEFDNKIVVEASIENCHEIECAILGNQDAKASVVGEIIPGAEFYNYETKYIDDKSQLVIPADLDEKTTARVQQLSVEAFKAMDGSGLARVDFFVRRNTHEVILNEVNTMPGFTPISMYPQLWAASGIPYADLIDKLIELAIEHHQSKQNLKRAF